MRLSLAPFVLASTAFAIGPLARDATASSIGLSAPTCAPLDPFAVKALREAVKDAYKPSFPGCALAIDVTACATLPQHADELVWVTGHGHSFSTTLTITRIVSAVGGSLGPGAGSFDVTRLELVRGTLSAPKYAGERSDSVRVLRGTLDAAKIADAIAVAEVAPTFTLRETSPPLLFGGMWMSSSDFVAALTLVGSGSVVDRSFAGYTASDTQLLSLPLSSAVARLDAAIPAGALVPSSYDAAARALFVSEFARRAPEFDRDFHWWVREAFVHAAGDGGDAALIPILCRYLPKSDPSSGERTRIAAISALAVLTGRDLRYASSGVERPVDIVAADYAQLLAGKP